VASRSEALWRVKRLYKKEWVQSPTQVFAALEEERQRL